MGKQEAAGRIVAGRPAISRGTAMPSRESVDAFVAQVLDGQFVAAIRDWYAEDAETRENQGPPKVGRETLIAGEQALLDRTSGGAKAELLSPPLVSGDRVALHWRFTFQGRSGARVMEEIAWQTWRGEKIWREQF